MLTGPYVITDADRKPRRREARTGTCTSDVTVKQTTGQFVGGISRQDFRTVGMLPAGYLGRLKSVIGPK